MPRIMYCAAVRRMGDTFSSRPNIGSQWPVAMCRCRAGLEHCGRNLSLSSLIAKYVITPIVMLSVVGLLTGGVTEVTGRCGFDGQPGIPRSHRFSGSLLEAVEHEVN